MSGPEFKVEYMSGRKRPAVLLSVDLSDVIEEILVSSKDDDQFHSLGADMSNLSGDLLFQDNILHELYRALDARLSLPNKESNALKEKISKSLAVVLLKNSAIEFIKNSVDSFLSLHESDLNEAMVRSGVLKVCFELEVNESEDKVQVTITDNAGGFKKDFIEEVEKKLSPNEFIFRHASSKKENVHTYGGHGLGLNQFLAGLEGVELYPDGKIKEKLGVDADIS